MPRNRLNDKQSLFAQLLAGGMNATDAYLRAFPNCKSRSVASANAYKLRRHPLIAASDARQTDIAVAAMGRAVERYGITADRVADAMARLAFTDIDQVASWETVQEGKQRRPILTIKDSNVIDRHAMAAISEVKLEAGGRIAVKLYNKREALMDIARLKGWIADKPVDQRQLIALKIER